MRYCFRRNSLRLFSTPPAQTVKPFHEIPCPNELPYLGSILTLIQEKQGYHIFYENLHKKYGDIVRFKFLGEEQISIARADLIKEVYLTNQTAPLRPTLEFWLMYRKKKGKLLSHPPFCFRFYI
jgi:hypothetical protein